MRDNNKFNKICEIGSSNFFGNRVYKCDEIFSVKYDLRCKNSSNKRNEKDNKIRGENSSSKFFWKLLKR